MTEYTVSWNGRYLTFGVLDQDGILHGQFHTQAAADAWIADELAQRAAFMAAYQRNPERMRLNTQAAIWCDY